MNPLVEQGKRLIQAAVQAELTGKLAELRKRFPDKNTSALWKELQTSEGELLAYCSRIESNDWSPAPRPSLAHVAEKPAVHSKPKDGDDRQVYVVMAGNKVVDIQLS